MSARSIGGPFIVEPERYGHMAFTREEADGAIANGTIVRKIASDLEGDHTPVGTLGEVIGSIDAPADALTDDEKARLDKRFWDNKYAYFVEWQGRPNEVLGVIGVKIEEV